MTDSRDPSGVGEHMLTLAVALVPHVEVRIAVPPEAGYLARRAAAMGIKARAGSDLGWLAGTDVAHVHAGIAWEGFELASAARRVAAAVVRTEHLPYLLTEPSQRAAYDAADKGDRLIAVSHGVAESFRTAGVKVPIDVVRNGIRTAPAVAARTETRTALAVGDDTPVVLAVGRMTAQKGHDALLDAMVRVDDARLWLVGGGPLEPALRAQAERLGIAARISWLGRRDDVADLIAAADLLALPSRFEGLPLVALEAMRGGLPVVATRVCGSDEAVVHDKTGLFVPVDDTAALAATLDSLLSDAPRRAAMARNARAHFAGTFTAERMATETMQIYARTLATAAADTRRRA